MTKKLVDQLARIRATKANIAKLRDQLREEHAALEDIISSLDSGDEDIDAGLRLIDGALDEMSKYL